MRSSLGIFAAATLGALLLTSSGPEAATPAPAFTLSVAPPKIGTIQTNGQVAGTYIMCGGAGNSRCSATFPAGTSVGLNFGGDSRMSGVIWGGDCATTTPGNSCTLKMSANHTVSAIPGSVLVTISLNENPQSAGAHPQSVGVDAGTPVKCTYASTTSATCTTMAAAPAGHFTASSSQASFPFKNWGGACSGTAPTCTLDTTLPQSITATFATAAYTLTVSPPTGGIVLSLSGNGQTQIACGAGATPCSAQVPIGFTAVLSYRPNTAGQLMTWTGDCAFAKTSPNCTLTMNQNHMLSATTATAVAAPPAAVFKP